MPLDLSGSAGCLCGTPTEVTWWLSARVAYLSAQKQSEPSPEFIYQLHKLLHFSWVACPNHQLLGIHKFIKFLGCLCGVGEPQYVFQTPNVFCYKKKHPVFFPRSSIIRFVKKETAWVFPSLVANFPMIHPVFRLCYIFMSPLSNITETGGGSFNHHGRGQFWQIPPFKV